jgi:glycogen operon protein
MAKLRHEHPVFRRRRFFEGHTLRGSGGVADIVWFTPSGDEMSDEDWDYAAAKSLQVFLNGQGIATVDERGERVVDDSFLLMFNAHHEPMKFTVPSEEYAGNWGVEVDTASPLETELEDELAKAGSTRTVEGRSIVVLRKLY